MSITSNDIRPVDRDASVEPLVTLRLEAPNNVSYGIFCDLQQAWLAPVAENVQRLLWYEKNWDSHGADPLNPTVVQEAFSILSRIMTDEYPVPRLSPTPSGGIQLEWRVPCALFQIEVEYDGVISAYLSDTRNGAAIDWEDDSVNEISLLQEKLSTLKVSS
ncbi:hypothetical protein BH11CYA1_BH11CYA1_16160 [soil metagenome]